MKEVTQHEETWENALALMMAEQDLAELADDCDELYLRFQQVLHRHPERKALVGPGMQRAENMRQRVLTIKERCGRAKALLLEWREAEGKLDK